MNKKEAIEKIKKLDEHYGIGEGVYLEKRDVVSIISQIEEQKKVTVPKFVGEWIEEAEKIHNNLSWVWFSNPACDELNEWLKNHTETFMRAWLDGYTVEQEKFYTVEIADAILTKITRGRNVQYKMLPSKYVSDVFDKGIYATRLTETEIKQKDERLWQFAESVEEN
jgi:hypothetical protein